MPIDITPSKVLIVEDEKTQRRLLQAKLEAEGYQVFITQDGRQGLQAFLDDPEIRLVLTDLSMPEMDGYQLIQELRKNESRYTYIIVLTANDDKDSLVRALALGADDYLTKPVCQDELSIRMISGRRLIRLEGQDEIIMSMVRMAGARSDETGTHLDRVKAYSRILALDLCETRRDLRLTHSWAEDVARVSPLHDIGKVAIADDILKKPGRLSEEAMELMKKHTVVGGAILLDIYERTGSSYLHLAYEVANFHHEKWDGSGYPEGLEGEAIPLSARIIALADTFDALTTKRCYKDAFPYEQAKNIILQGRGTHFDPQVLDAYLRHEVEWLAVLARYQ